jgi:hypothetical protein
MSAVICGIVLLGSKPRLVSEMEVDTAVQWPIVLKSRSAATADGVAIVASIPGEFQARVPAAWHRSTVHPSLDSYKSEAARAVRPEFEEAWTHQFDRVAIPEFHLEDPPPTNQSHRCPLGQVTTTGPSLTESQGLNLDVGVVHGQRWQVIWVRRDDEGSTKTDRRCDHNGVDSGTGVKVGFIEKAWRHSGGTAIDR